MTRSFVRAIGDIVGPALDIVAPDMNTNAQTMAWIMDEYSAAHGYSPAVATGKPVALHGSVGRADATGRGVSLLTAAHYRTLGFKLEGARIVLQGFGNVGSHAARQLHDMGACIIAVGDATGTVYDPAGLDIPALARWVAEKRTIVGYATADGCTKTNLLETPCDILIPAALGGVIDSEVASRLQAGLVVEAANAPVTAGGAAVLAQRGIPVLPDVLANAGGVVVSYFEWTQNLTEFRWKEERVHTELEEILMRAHTDVLRVAQEQQCDLRTAAYVLAIGRVADATRLRWLG
jgi:glutamate dehydrogenase (NAD(P)+)